MKFVKSVTKSSRGRPEGRILVKRGEFGMVKYFDLSKGRVIENKFKIYLKSKDGVVGYLFIKLKEEGKYLVFEDKEVDKDIYVYNEDTGEEEPLFR